MRAGRETDEWASQSQLWSNGGTVLFVDDATAQRCIEHFKARMPITVSGLDTLDQPATATGRVQSVEEVESRGGETYFRVTVVED